MVGSPRQGISEDDDQVSHNIVIIRFLYIENTNRAYRKTYLGQPVREIRLKYLSENRCAHNVYVFFSGIGFKSFCEKFECTFDRRPRPSSSTLIL